MFSYVMTFYMMSDHSLAIFTLLKDWAASYYVSHGVPPEMINIGMALYGRSFTLKDPNMNDVGDPVRGAGQRGRYTREKGFISYYEVKTIVALHCCNLLRVGICIDHARTKCE